VPYAGDRLSVLLSRITSHATLTDEAASAEIGGARTAGTIRLSAYIEDGARSMRLRVAKSVLVAGIFSVFLGLVGCLSPIALHRAVLEYDRTMTQIENELLLLNIARVRNNDSIHFTGISSVIATFSFSTSTGISGFYYQTPGLASSNVGMNISTTASESPTITIAPIQGEEFTKRLLTPMDESKLEFLAHQGIDLAIILRLMVSEIVIRGQGQSAYALNQPSKPEQYKELRRRILHLSSLRLANNLHISPIRFKNAKDEEVIGRLAITNFDLGSVPNDYRQALHEETKHFPRNHVLVVIGLGFAGGEYPLHGRMKLRNFKEILSFVGRGMGEEKEFDVEKDPRTGPIWANPIRTLAIRETEKRPKDGILTVEHRGFWYSIAGEANHDKVLSQWNNQAFDVLYQLFQMTVTDVGKAQSPAIAITK
jgi:hypothetical protein